MTLTHADMVKLEKHRGLVAMLPRYDKPLRGPGKRIREGDRSIRPGAIVEFANGTVGLRTYGSTGFAGLGQVWAQAEKIGRHRAWWIVDEHRQAYLVAEPDMIVRQGVGEQMTLDTTSNASRQHYIDTGEYLPMDEAELPNGVAGVSGDSSL